MTCALAIVAVPGIGEEPFSSTTVSACAVTQLGKRVPRRLFILFLGFFGRWVARRWGSSCFAVRPS